MGFPSRNASVTTTDVLPRRVHHLRANFVECSGHERSRRLCVSTAAEAAGEDVHIDVPDTPERDLDLAVAEVAEEKGEPRADDRARMLDDAVEVLRSHAV